MTAVALPVAVAVTAVWWLLRDQGARAVLKAILRHPFTTTRLVRVDGRWVDATEVDREGRS
jgi:hypothetical protein